MSKCRCGCDKEVVSSGTKPKLFYSDACRKRYNRTNLQEQTDKRTQSQADKYKRTVQADTVTGFPGDDDYNGCMEFVNDQWQQKIKSDIPLTEYSRQRLETAIRSYPNDTWVNSPEHKELMVRLRTLTVEQLKEQGYLVPLWKYNR